ncbi:MAG: hypothetical protein LUH20_09845 [Lachnospiraceae bacterium]|nr:hypothetical protein [Lachnospiraceae bacterium]
MGKARCFIFIINGFLFTHSILLLFVLYPLCRKNYDLFTRVIARAAGICILGYGKEQGVNV